MVKKKKFSVWIAREFTTVAEDEDQANLKTQQFLNIPIEEFKKFKIETAEIDLDFEKLCGRKLYDEVDFR